MATKTTFQSVGVCKWLVSNCSSMGIKFPTDIQVNCIPPILAGEDVIGCAETGSGKTAAFALPILQKLSDDPFGVFCLVLTPTRELAFQIAEQFRSLGSTLRLKTTVIVGGMDMQRQALELAQKPHVVIATPGRCADHLLSGDTFKLNKIQFLVLDEADRLFEESFADHLRIIMERLNPNRQTLLFSATMTHNLCVMEQMAMDTPFKYTQKSVTTVDTLKQEFVFIPPKVKECYMFYALQNIEHESAIIFVSTCWSCQLLCDMLTELGIEAVALHSQMSQRRRLAALGKFKSMAAKVLVSTDVASRGLDIPTVELVVNFAVPQNPTDYVHRVGRTARAGRGGRSLTLVTQYDVKLIHQIEKLIEKQLETYEVEEDSVLDLLTKVTTAKRTAKLMLHERGFDEKVQQNKERNRKRKQSAGEKDGEPAAKKFKTNTKQNPMAQEANSKKKSKKQRSQRSQKRKSI